METETFDDMEWQILELTISSSGDEEGVYIWEYNATTEVDGKIIEGTAFYESSEYGCVFSHIEYEYDEEEEDDEDDNEED